MSTTGFETVTTFYGRIISLPYDPLPHINSSPFSEMHAEVFAAATFLTKTLSRDNICTGV
jgi:hypothetical protein